MIRLIILFSFCINLFAIDRKVSDKYVTEAKETFDINFKACVESQPDGGSYDAAMGSFLGSGGSVVLGKVVDPKKFIVRLIIPNTPITKATTLVLGVVSVVYNSMDTAVLKDKARIAAINSCGNLAGKKAKNNYLKDEGKEDASLYYKERLK